MDFQVEKSWKKHLGDEFKKPYMEKLLSFLEEEKYAGKTVYPSEEHIFEAQRLI